MASSRHRKGSADDAARSIAKYLPMVRRVCGAHLSRRHEIEDAVQETFVQFLLADRSRIANHEAWLVTVAARVCGHAHRWRYRHPEVGLLADLRSTPAADVLDDVLQAVWYEKVASHLPDIDRHVLTWLYVHQLPRESVAQHLGVTTEHLRVIAHRARRRARRLFQAFDDTVGI
jgi:RNA polymerase sigma factor (sigma-70 family)